MAEGRDRRGGAHPHRRAGQDRRGEYQVQAAVAALHDDAPSAAETDWVQVLAWYDDLVALTDNPVARLSRAVAVGEVDGPLAGLRALDGLDDALGDHHRLDAVRAHLHERAGDLETAAGLYLRAARRTTSTAERDHLTKKAAGCTQPASPPPPRTGPAAPGRWPSRS